MSKEHEHKYILASQARKRMYHDYQQALHRCTYLERIAISQNFDRYYEEWLKAGCPKPPFS